MLRTLAAVLLLLAAPAQSQEKQGPRGQKPAPSASEGPRSPWSSPLAGEIVRHTEAPGLKVFFKAVPAAVGLMQAFQGERDGWPRLRQVDWPLARLETTVPFSLGGARLPPANYALVLIPSRGGQPMQLEIRRVAAGEFLQSNTMSVPAGEAVQRMAFRGTFGASDAGALAVAAKPRPGGGAVVTFHYGDWQAALELLP